MRVGEITGHVTGGRRACRPGPGLVRAWSARYRQLRETDGNHRELKRPGQGRCTGKGAGQRVAVVRTDNAEVAGSIPASPTRKAAGQPSCPVLTAGDFPCLVR